MTIRSERLLVTRGIPQEGGASLIGEGFDCVIGKRGLKIVEGTENFGKGEEMEVLRNIFQIKEQIGKKRAQGAGVKTGRKRCRGNFHYG